MLFVTAILLHLHDTGTYEVGCKEQKTQGLFELTMLGLTRWMEIFVILMIDSYVGISRGLFSFALSYPKESIHVSSLLYTINKKVCRSGIRGKTTGNDMVCSRWSGGNAMAGKLDPTKVSFERKLLYT